MEILKITFVIIGALIGAGFASGQEIYLFFFSHGVEGILGIIISSTLLGIIIYKVLTIIIINKIENYKQFLETIFISDSKIKKISIQAISIIINLFILITFFIMIAGFGTYLEESFHIPQTIGSCILAILTIITLSKQIKGIIKVSESIVPILMLFIIIIGVISIKDINILKLHYYVVKIQKTNWIISSILYTSYNMILLIPVLISLNKIIKQKQTIKISILVSLITIILAICIYFAMVKINIDIRLIEMPVSYAIATRMPYLNTIYGIVILASILTTAISLGAGFLQNINIEEKNKIKIFILICIISIPISKIGFSKLIQILYPIFGYLGLAEIFLIFYRFYNIE